MNHKIKQYPDKSTYAIVDLDEKEFTYFINSYNDLWQLSQIVDVFNYHNIRPIITIPCLIDAQADRRFDKIQSSNLKLVCKFLNSMDANFKIFHPHNPEVVEALMDRVEIIDNKEFIINVILNIYSNVITAEKNCILMSSAAGGFKPLMKFCDKLYWSGEIESASKARKFEDNKSTLVQKIDRTDFNSKDILIVDDICVYGGTFIGLSKLLKERNVGKVYLAISHMTVEKPNSDLWFHFDKIFTTNSKGIEYFDYNDCPPKILEIINCF